MAKRPRQVSSRKGKVKASVRIHTSYERHGTKPHRLNKEFQDFIDSHLIFNNLKTPAIKFDTIPGTVTRRYTSEPKNTSHN